MADLAGKLGKKKLTDRSYVEQMQDLSAQPEYAIGQPQDNRASLKEAIDRASSLYDKESSTNDWAEVGQMLGKAAAQYAGAQAGMGHEGKYGRNMGGLDTGPSIDYGARTDRAFRKYQQTIRNAQDLNAVDKTQFSEGEAAKKQSFERAQEPLKLGAQAEREDARTRASDARTQAAEAARLEKEKRDREQHNTDLNIKDTQGDEKATADKLKNAQTLLSNEEVLDDLGSKDASKLQSKYGAVAGMAGIDLAQVKAEAEAAPEVDKSILGFAYKGKDPDAYKKALKGHIDAIRRDLDEIRSRKKGLLGGSKPAGPDQSVMPGGEPTQKTVNDAQLQAYAKQYKMTPEAARQYLESQGFTYQK